ncbi:MAG: histidine triad nucleotide-binding protein [Pseudomonadales bacterium]|jgi:histidine triad (HIT) family protein|uniref:histidine triad nucleotide-binding protein n=1 Tax=Candidatus Njordibacter sp. Uisw_056 TaxID=3230973 RepID=UPI002384D4C8|nr:histidine triad nucleotide-binding protein [Pseudomonadales bacterium]|tara:strand:+ start:4677 stop:5009 length:333 start_codon:yes stop_codon:yes gene_type:complete
MSTIFDKIISREIPADIIYEDEQVLAFKDIAPKAPVHYLIIPKQPIATLNDANPEHQALLGHMMLTAAKLAKEAGVAEGGYRVQMNCNPDGGQVVYHIHLHLMGGRAFCA